MMRLEWSPDALDDLDAIYDAIALDDEVAPRIGIQIEELGDDAFRELHYRGYTIIYEICEKAVRIHEVYNQRRIYIRTYNKR